MGVGGMMRADASLMGHACYRCGAASLLLDPGDRRPSRRVVLYFEQNLHLFDGHRQASSFTVFIVNAEVGGAV